MFSYPTQRLAVGIPYPLNIFASLPPPLSISSEGKFAFSAASCATFTTCEDGSCEKPGYAISIFNSALRSEEHTSELQSRFDLVCRLLLEKTYECYRVRYRVAAPVRSD